MGITERNKQVNNFDLKSLLDLWKVDVMMSMNCHAIGTIQSFDEDHQTARMTINYKTTVNGEEVPYPILIDCPVIILSGGAGSLTFPISEGDTCLILFNDRDINNWFAGKSTGSLATQRIHSFSDAIALVGLRSLANPVQDYDTERVTLQNGDTSIGLSSSKIRLKNETTTLNTLLQSLCTQLETLCTQIEAITVICSAPTSPSSIPVNAAAIAAISVSISTIATNIGGLLE